MSSLLNNCLRKHGEVCLDVFETIKRSIWGVFVGSVQKERSEVFGGKHYYHLTKQPI